MHVAARWVLILTNGSAPMAQRLKGRQIAILATHGFEQSEPVSYTHLTLPTNREV